MISPIREGFLENKTLAKISKFTVVLHSVRFQQMCFLKQLYGMPNVWKYIF